MKKTARQLGKVYISVRNIIGIVIAFAINQQIAPAQISPGDLSVAHANLEGISNCTQCHVLGSKVSVDKCLACHTEIRDRINLQKGYHSSADVKGKLCFACHSEHNGKNFHLIRFDTVKFDHKLTGYNLSVPHAKTSCKACHSAKNITDQKLKTKKNTFLGLNTECLICHTDYHQQTLSPVCLNCHTSEAFKPASKFSHTTSKFQLVGKHKSVDCLKCHKVQVINGSKFQEFRGVQYGNCTSCHKDPHKNQFGQNCRQCHNEESFHAVKGVANFDHNKTDFRLEGKHITVSCNTCHKTKLTDPLKHDRCSDCHTDYHKEQFVKNGITPDCFQCHVVTGFSQSKYTQAQHDAGPFPLKGAHGAVPCYECHKKQEKWNFREIGANCKDCHKDIHLRLIEPKYYPEGNCKICHNENRWADITFDHSVTKFNLTGAHKKQGCRACHFKPDEKGIVQQRFYEQSSACTSCHTDKHYRQFEKNGITNCIECHDTDNWKASKFNHNNTAFRLDGKHVNVACGKCHKPQQEGNTFYVKYKLKDYRCESCH